MRRMISTLLGLTILLPTPALADHLSAMDLRTIPPVSSHYVQRIIDRANAAIALADAEPAITNFGFVKLSWVQAASAAILSLVDTQLRIQEQQRDIREFTACLHLDLILLEAKIEEVQGKMHSAVQDAKPWAIVRLASLTRFLNDRYRELLRGWNNPLWDDISWGRQYIFDPAQPVWCCKDGIPGNACELQDESVCFVRGVAFQTPRACQEYGCLVPPSQDPLEGKLCPFHSDYLPPTSGGYGCDTSVLFSRTQSGGSVLHRPTQWEYNALKGLTEARDEFFDTLEDLPDTINLMEQFAGLPPSDLSGFAATGSHITVFGCPMPTTDGGIIPPQLYGSGATAFDLRGPFSLDRDEPFIQYRFYRLIRDWAVLHPYPEDMRLPTDYPPGLLRQNATTLENQRTFTQKIVRHLFRFLVDGWVSRQADIEGRAVSKGQDAPLRIREVVYPELRTSVASLARLASTESQGIRKFTLGFAYYLRRSCVYRPCNLKLEQIMKIVFEDACFPYVSRRYDQESPPIYSDCKTDADITVTP